MIWLFGTRCKEGGANATTIKPGSRQTDRNASPVTDLPDASSQAIEPSSRTLRRIGKASEEPVSNPRTLNPHTTAADTNETEAIKLAFGDHASRLVINSTKSMTGHLLGAAGGIESIFTTLAVYHQVSPPTINIFNQDPECDLDYCANEARPMRIDTAISNSFGFGGTNGTLVIKRLD